MPTHQSPFSLVEIEPVGQEPEKVNPQLFENAEFQTDPATEAYANSPDALHNSNPPSLGIIHEKPEHRLICYLKAKGVSNDEIARRTGYTVPWISQLTRQPWFRLRLVQELKEAGLDAVREVIKGAALDSVFTLIDIRDDENAPKTVRRASADSILDRFLGKSVQPLEVSNPSVPSTPDTRKLDEQIAQAEKELGLQPNS